MTGHKPKRVHKAALVCDDARVSALCFAKPRAIVLSRATWTFKVEHATCPKCLAIIFQRNE